MTLAQGPTVIKATRVAPVSNEHFLVHHPRVIISGGSDPLPVDLTYVFDIAIKVA